MKKTISFILLLALSLFFAGCSEKNDFPENSPSHGKISGNTYKSDYTGLCFTLPSQSWSFSSEEELAAGCFIDASAYKSSDFSQVLKENPTVYDMIATCEADRISVLTGFDNLALSGGDPNLSASDYVSRAIESFVAGLNTDSTSYTVSDTEKITLCGHTYYRKILTISGEDSWGNNYTLCEAYYARNLGDYMSVTHIYFSNTVTIEEIEAFFA